jgi:hypothetical protein
MYDSIWYYYNTGWYPLRMRQLDQVSKSGSLYCCYHPIGSLHVNHNLREDLVCAAGGQTPYTHGNRGTPVELPVPPIL